MHPYRDALPWRCHDAALAASSPRGEGAAVNSAAGNVQNPEASRAEATPGTYLRLRHCAAQGRAGELMPWLLLAWRCCQKHI